MPLISIIVPVYRVEKYLKKCVESILTQTFKDFELILVDDGSPDNCGKLCDEYAVKDSRIKVIHKKNGGLSDARNSGIAIAEGRFLGFIDSDDYIECDMYEMLYNNMVKYDADVSICTDFICFENGKVIKSNEKKVLVLNTEKAIGQAYKISPGVCNKLFKKEIFTDIRFPVGKLNEDVFIFMDILSKAKTIVFTTEPKYHYIQRKNSITKSTFDKRKWNIVEAWEKNLKFVKINYPKQEKSIEFKYLGSYLHLLDYLIMLDDYKNLVDYEKVRKFILQNVFKIIRNPYIIFKRKLAILVYVISPNFYRKIVLKLMKSRGIIS